MRISQEGIELIKKFEGFSPEIYRCSAGKPTIGFGHVIREGESFPGPITIERGRELLEKDLAWVEAALARHVKVPLTQNEYDALGSFIFNVGPERFRTSTLLYRLNSGDRAAVAKEWLRWNKGRVMGKLKVIDGLKARREAELKLFLAVAPASP